jgi:RimJ/RimL family protein N-acetyltransferase
LTLRNQNSWQRSASNQLWAVGIQPYERMAFVVFDGEALVGVGSYAALNGPSVIEISIVVADDYQRHGVGTFHLSLLAEYAHAEGYLRLVAQFSADNEAMREIFIRSPFLTEFRRHHGVIDVQLDLTFDVATTGLSK